MADLTKIKQAFDRAGHIALIGTREQRSGRFIPVKQEQKETQSFLIKLHKTYYNMGFFNVSVDYDNLFGSDEEEITIFLNDQKEKFILGHINRTANQNKTPRIMGTKKLRDWFQTTFTLNDNIEIVLLSKNEIIIKPTHNA